MDEALQTAAPERKRMIQPGVFLGDEVIPLDDHLLLWRHQGQDRWYAVIEGTQVPHLTLGQNDEKTHWRFLLDNRLGFFVPDEALEDVLVLVANAMAIAAGWTCFGKDSSPINLFGKPLWSQLMIPEGVLS